MCLYASYSYSIQTRNRKYVLESKDILEKVVVSNRNTKLSKQPQHSHDSHNTKQKPFRATELNASLLSLEKDPEMVKHIINYAAKGILSPSTTY